MTPLESDAMTAKMLFAAVYGKVLNDGRVTAYTRGTIDALIRVLERMRDEKPDDR